MDNEVNIPYRRGTEDEPIMQDEPSSWDGQSSLRPYSGAVNVLTGVTQEGSLRGAMVVPV